jgi:hypothetical protein
VFLAPKWPNTKLVYLILAIRFSVFQKGMYSFKTQTQAVSFPSKLHNAKFANIVTKTPVHILDLRKIQIAVINK